MNAIEVLNAKSLGTSINKSWSPQLLAELNGQHIKLARFEGIFPWHAHQNEDEAFLVVDGSFIMRYRTDGQAGEHSSVAEIEKTLNAGELIVIPAGVEHSPMTLEGETALVMLFEPASTEQYGD